MDEGLHLGKDGIDIRGRDAVVLGVVVLFAVGISIIFWDHLQRDNEEKKTISSRMESLQRDHVLLRDSVENNTAALNGVRDQMELQSFLMIATPNQEARAREIIGVPKLLRQR